MKTIRKAFKFRLNTTPEIEHRFTQFADASRFIWNKALGINLHRLNNGYPISWLSEMQFWLGIWKSSDTDANLPIAAAINAAFCSCLQITSFIVELRSAINK